MTKSKFGDLAKEASFAKPPRIEEGASAIIGVGAVRAMDGRTARRTGRTKKFATVVSEEFQRWLKTQAAARGKSMAALLDDMRAAYVEKYGD
jgi:hypothetical protein